MSEEDEHKEKSSSGSLLRALGWQVAVVLIPLLTGLDTTLTAAGNAGLARTLGSTYWAVTVTYSAATILCWTWALCTAKESFLVILAKVKCYLLPPAHFSSFSHSLSLSVAASPKSLSHSASLKDTVAVRSTSKASAPAFSETPTSTNIDARSETNSIDPKEPPTPTETYSKLRWFTMLGGFCGAFQNFVAAIVSKRMGTAVYSLGQLFGCVVMSCIIDHYGLAWVARRKVTWLSALGVIVLTIGAFTYRFRSFLGSSDEVTSTAMDYIYLGEERMDGSTEAESQSIAVQLTCVLFAVLSGVSGAFQGPLGANLGRVAGQFRWAAAWSFLSGLLPCFVMAFAVTQLPEWRPMRASEALYKFTPGVMVIISLFVTAWMPRYVPVATVWCLLISGQLLSSTVLDSQGWLGMTKRAMDALSVVGIVVVLAGVAILAYARHRDARKAKVPPNKLTIDP